MNNQMYFYKSTFFVLFLLRIFHFSSSVEKTNENAKITETIKTRRYSRSTSPTLFGDENGNEQNISVKVNYDNFSQRLSVDLGFKLANPTEKFSEIQRCYAPKQIIRRASGRKYAFQRSLYKEPKLIIKMKDTAPVYENNFVHFQSTFHCESHLIKTKRALGSTSCGQFLEKMENSLKNLGKSINQGRTLEKEALAKLEHTKVNPFARKVNIFANCVALSLFGASMFEDLLHADFKNVAINTVYFVTAYALASQSNKLYLIGAELIEKRSIKLGWALKSSVPFIKGISAGFSVYQFVESLKEYLNTNNKDALANLIASSFIAAVDLVDLGVTVAAVVGLVSGTTASVTGGIAIGVTVIVFVGLKIYYAVKHVEEIEKVITLSSWDKFREGGKWFFTGSGLESIDKRYKVQLANNKIMNEAIKSLVNSKSTKMLFLPDANYNGENLDFSLDNTIDMRNYNKSYNRPLQKYKVQAICLPESDDYDQLVNQTICQNVIGVLQMGYDVKNEAHFELMDGNDYVYAADMKNTFMLGNGRKEIVGNNGQDVFVLNGNNTTGNLSGNKGYDIIIMEQFYKNNPIKIYNVNADEMIINHTGVENNNNNSYNYISFTGIEEIQGRSHDTDIISVACSLKQLNTKDGIDKTSQRDIIHLEDSCHYNITINIEKNTIVRNNALRGLFYFHFITFSGKSFIYLKKGSYQNLFHFACHIDDLIDLKRVVSNIKFTIKDPAQNEIGHISVKNFDNQTLFIFKKEYDADIILRFTDKNSYLMVQNSNLRCRQIAKVYKNTVNKFGFVLRAISKSDSAAVVIGHDKGGLGKTNQYNILRNDEDQTTHIYPGSLKNIFLIATNDTMYNNTIEKFRVPKVVIHYEKKSFYVDEIDLSMLERTIQWKFGLNLDVEVYFDTSKNDVILALFAGSAKFQVGEVILKNVIKYEAFKNIIITTESQSQLSINMTEALVPNDAQYYCYKTICLEPVPLSFDSKQYDTIVITTSDVSYGNEIFVDKSIVGYDYFAANSSLVITNVGIKGIKPEQVFTVLLYDFFNQPKLQSLFISFNDLVISIPAAIQLHGLNALESSRVSKN